MKQCLGRNRNFRRCGRTVDQRWLCSDHRKQPLVLLVFVVCTLGTAVVAYHQSIADWISRRSALNQPAFDVSPTTVTLAENDRRSIALIHIRNPSQQFLYRVTVKTTLESDSLSFSDLTMSLSNDERDEKHYMITPASGTSTRVRLHNSVMMVFCLDPQNKPTMFVFLDELPPLKGITLQIEVPSQVLLSPGPHVLRSVCESCTNAPSPSWRQQDESELSSLGPWIPAGFTLQGYKEFAVLSQDAKLQ